jgi:hypothetical protein
VQYQHNMSYLQKNRSVGSFEGDAGSSMGDEETLTPHEAYEIERQNTRYPDAEREEENHTSQPIGSASTAHFWTQRRKLITAASSIALVVVAAAVGVVVSTKSSPANQKSLAEDVVITDEVGEAPPSISGDTVELVAVEPAPELVSTEIIEDGDGIIYDVVAQQEVTVAEPDFDLDIVEFKGDLTDFIDSNVARFSIDADDESCDAQGALWDFAYTTDAFPWETSWELLRGDERWAHGPPAKSAYNRLTNYRGSLCLPEGEYTMIVLDSEGDGSCCEFGIGGFKVMVGEVVIAESDMTQNDPFDKRTFGFTVLPKQATTTSTVASGTTTTITTTTTVAADESATQDTTQDPTKSPSRAPTAMLTQSPSVSPSPVPTPEPTSKVTPEVTSPDAMSENCPSPNVIVGIEILTDANGSQTGYTFEGGDTFNERATGTMSSQEKYLDEVCVSPGTYKLTMLDSKGNGLQDPAYVAVYVGGEKVLHDYTFNAQSKSYTIQAGFNPSSPMTAIDREWLDGHNKRREQFHEANEKEFRPLTWSPKIAQDASVWAAKIIKDGCVVSREQNLSSGELTFAMTSANEEAAIAEPESIMNRWYNNHIDESVPELVLDSEVPGLAFTQVTWLATRYIGCTKQVGQLLSDKYCHVAICRYAFIRVSSFLSHFSSYQTHNSPPIAGIKLQEIVI